ncbi:hypothetical protein Tco_0526948 [Tanacetum coccineum]
MMSKKMAELEDDFHGFKTHTERRVCFPWTCVLGLTDTKKISDMEEEDLRHEDRTSEGMDEWQEFTFFFNWKSSSPVQSSRTSRQPRGNDTWADAGLKHGSYFLLDRIPEDGWFFHDESRFSKKPLCRSNLEVHLQFHVDRLETGSQVKTWDPGIKFVRCYTLRTRCF